VFISNAGHSFPKSGPSEDHELSFFQIAFRHLGVDAVRMSPTRGEQLICLDAENA